MNRIRIYEGCDGTGKSTLAEKDAKRLGLRLIHFGAPKDEVEEMEQIRELQTLIRSGENLAIDRCWYSNMVYGPLYRNRNLVTPSLCVELEHDVKANYTDFQIIYCWDRAANIIARLKVRGEDYINLADVEEILEDYEKIMDMVDPAIPVIRYRIQGATIYEPSK